MPDGKAIEDIILQSVENAGKATVKDISIITNTSIVITKKILEKLCSDGKIERLETSRGIYYIPIEGITYGQLEKMGSEINKVIYRAEDDTENVRDQIKGLEDDVNKIYSNFISLMSIFVAVFSLVLVNANIVFKITEQNIENFTRSVVIVNLSVCVCITIFVVLIRLIVLKPINRKK